MKRPALLFSLPPFLPLFPSTTPSNHPFAIPTIFHLCITFIMIELCNFPGSHGAEPEVFEVYQRCILVSGQCTTNAAIEDEVGSVVAQVRDSADASLFPEQRWPMCRGNFKALVLLSTGLNRVIITTGQDAPCCVEVKCPPSTPFSFFSQAASRSRSGTRLSSRRPLFIWQS